MNKYVIALVASLAASSALAGDVYVAGNLGTQVEGAREELWRVCLLFVLAETTNARFWLRFAMCAAGAVRHL